MTAQETKALRSNDLADVVCMTDESGKQFWVLRYRDGHYVHDYDSDSVATFDTKEEAENYLPKEMYHEAASTAGTETT